MLDVVRMRARGRGGVSPRTGHGGRPSLARRAEVEVESGDNHHAAAPQPFPTDRPLGPAAALQPRFQQFDRRPCRPFVSSACCRTVDHASYLGGAPGSVGLRRHVLDYLDTDYANLLRVPDRRALAGKRDYALLRVL